MKFRNINIMCKFCYETTYYNEVEIDMDVFNFSVEGSVCEKCGLQKWLIVDDEEEFALVQ